MEFARKVMAGWRSGKKTVYNKKTRRQQRITEKTMDRANFAINVQKRRSNSAYPGDYPADSVLDDGMVYIDKIDALMEKHKGHPNWSKLYSRWERAINATERGSVDGAKRAYESALELVRQQNPSSWDQAEYRCTAGTEGRLRKAAKAKGYKDVMLFADKVMDGWRKNKRVWNKKTKKWNLIDKKLMQSANFAVTLASWTL